MTLLKPRDRAVFEPWLAHWQLAVMGPIITSDSCRLVEVLYQGQEAMLKVCLQDDAKGGDLLLSWWEGQGAVKLFASAPEGEALLLEYLEGREDLTAMVSAGQDDEATRILCQVAAKLHACPKEPPAGLISLREWFADLEQASQSHGGYFTQAWAVAKHLLANPRDEVVLHGDLHHGNVLDGEERGWLAIDPKRLHGERAFDFANIFSNPDALVAKIPGRLERQVEVVCEAAALERSRLLAWVVAWLGLSATWFKQDGDDAAAAAQVALGRRAAALL